MYFVIDNKRSLGWTDVMLMVMLVVYTMLGAFVFISLEKPQEEKRKTEQYIKEMEAYREHNESKIILEQIAIELEEKTAMIIRAQNSSEQKAILWCLEKADIPKPIPVSEREKNWTIFGGIFYSSSIYTTVGYGKITCVTTWGRIMTMLYALFGIPMIILVLNDLGNLLFRFTCWSWNLMAKQRQKLFKNRNIGVRCCMPTEIKSLTNEHDYLNMETVPLSLALFICIAYICTCSFIYCSFEDWAFFTSFYYFFTSFTTVGFGDVVPHNMKYATMCGVLVLIGLAVVSMCLNVIQAKMDATFKKFMKVIDDQFKEALQSRADGMQSFSVKDALSQMQGKQTMVQKVLFKMMSDERKQMIYDKWEEKAKMRNAGVQTEPLTEDVGSQTYNRSKSAVTTQTMARNCHPCRGGSVERIYLNFDHIHQPSIEHNHIHDHHHDH